MQVELTGNPGYYLHREPPGGAGNASNGLTPKTLASDHTPRAPRRSGSAGELRWGRRGMATWVEDREKAPAAL
jgi:hypothetical protein